MIGNKSKTKLKKHKSLKVNIIQCVTIGPPTVGKTTLKEQLLANNEESLSQILSTSTSVASKVEKVVINVDKKSLPLKLSVSNYQWKKLANELVKKIKQSVNDMLIYLYCAIFSTIYCYYMPTSITVPFSTNYRLLYLLEYIIISGVFHYRFMSFIIAAIGHREAVLSDSEIINRTLEDPTTVTLYFRDCGGQPEFHEILPALVSQSTLFLLVFNLCDDFNKQYNVQYITTRSSSRPYNSSYTVKQSLLQCLASISSIGNYSKPKHNYFGCKIVELVLKYVKKWIQKCQSWNVNISKVIIIGTHKDKLNITPIKEITTQLEKELMDTDWYSHDMIVPTSDGDLALEINTFDCNDIIKVKDMINEVVSTGRYSLDVPISWLSLENYIQSKKKKILSFKMCQSLGKECGIYNASEFRAALWFLHHKLGTIRYFEDVPELSDIIITDPQVLFDTITELIVHTFNFENLHSKYQYDRFCNSGRFTEKHLSNCEAVKKNLLSTYQIIAVLQYLITIAPVDINENGEQEYFFPCVLVHASLPSSSLDSTTDVPPLLITFKCGYVPRGIFSSLIARVLLTSKGHWTLASDKIYRDQIQFRIMDSGHIVTIRNCFRYLELTIQSPIGSNTCSDVCVTVCKFISECLEYIRNQLNYTSNATHFFGFHSNGDCCSDSSVGPHLALCPQDSNPTYTVCTINKDYSSVLTSKQKMWFDTTKSKYILLITSNCVLL